jgi:hypothetical protein
LDTLDRQGLKFLKETLRASKLFGLNTQELNHSHPIVESSIEEAVIEKKQPAPKKIETTKNMHVKKPTKVEQQKKPATSQKQRQPEAKGELGDKINKKLESLNIKTSKRVDQKPSQPKPIVRKGKEKMGSGGEIAE